jgi:hypothetical protein
MHDLRTNHHAPWALVKRAGNTVGKRISTRMAYLVSTVAPDGHAVALTGYVMNNDMTGWTKTIRRIEWSDVVKTWRKQPTKADVQKAKRRLPVFTVAMEFERDMSRAAIAEGGQS